MLHKSRQSREIVALVVLHDYQRALAHKARREYGAGNLGKPVHIIRRVGEHNVESLRRRRYIAQGVAAHQRQIVSAKLLGYLLNEALLRRRLLYSRGRAAAPAEELECDGSRAGKQVEGVRPLDVCDVLYDIEYVFTGKIRRGSCRYVRGNIETATSVFSSYYSHSGIRINGKGALSASRPLLKAADGNMTGITYPA